LTQIIFTVSLDVTNQLLNQYFIIHH